MSVRVIELTVRDHGGTLSQIVGLFARRAFDLLGLLCGPGQGQTRSVYLLVKGDERLANLVRNLEKLYDVLDVRLREECAPSAFFDPGALVAGAGQEAAEAYALATA